jgi:hypothetical protein
MKTQWPYDYASRMSDIKCKIYWTGFTWQTNRKVSNGLNLRLRQPNEDIIIKIENYCRTTGYQGPIQITDALWAVTGLWLRRLTPFSTIFQLYRCSQFYWWMEPKYPEKTTDLPQFIDFITFIMVFISNLELLHNAHLRFSLGMFCIDTHIECCIFD